MFVAAIAATTVGAPLSLGAVHPWQRLVLESVMAITAIAWALSRRPDRLEIMLAPLAALCLTGVQLMPLPGPVLAMVAPLSAATWQLDPQAMPPSTRCVSIDPAATALGCWRLMLGMAMVAVVADVGRQPFSRQLICGSLALSGMLIWALGIAFPCPGATGMLLGRFSIAGPFAVRGRTPLEAPVATAAFGYPEWFTIAGERYLADEWVVGDGFGPYVISNHLAGALCLTLPFACAAWFHAARRLPVTLRFSVAAAGVAAALWTTGAMALSRAGAGALLLAAMLSFAWAAPGRRFRAGLLTVGVLYAATIAVFFALLYGAHGNITSVLPKAARETVDELLSNGRSVATGAALKMFTGSPLLGTGVGTYGDLHPTIVGAREPWFFAHNDYAQWLGETGIAGGIAALAGCWMLATAFLAWARAQGGNADCGLGAWPALAALAVHSGFDWNLHVPANGFLACVVAGLAIASAPRHAQERRRPRWLSWVASLALAIACLLGLAAVARDAVSEAAQRQLREVLVADRIAATDHAPAPADSAFVEAINAGERMAAWDPWNAQLAALLGQANLHLSARPLVIDEADARRKAAADWFEWARGHCPVCRGVAEPEQITTGSMTTEGRKDSVAP
jgi:O-antigen ligase